MVLLPFLSNYQHFSRRGVPGSLSPAGDTRSRRFWRVVYRRRGGGEAGWMSEITRCR